MTHAEVKTILSADPKHFGALCCDPETREETQRALYHTTRGAGALWLSFPSIPPRPRSGDALRMGSSSLTCVGSALGPSLRLVLMNTPRCVKTTDAPQRLGVRSGLPAVAGDVTNFSVESGWALFLNPLYSRNSTVSAAGVHCSDSTFTYLTNNDPSLSKVITISLTLFPNP